MFFCGVAITFIIFSEEIITYKCLSGLLHVIENLQSRGISEFQNPALKSWKVNSSIRQSWKIELYMSKIFIFCLSCEEQYTDNVSCYHWLSTNTTSQYHSMQLRHCTDEKRNEICDRIISSISCFRTHSSRLQ